jgi:hypothetical protein
MSNTPLPVVSAPELPAAQTLVCANCHAPLPGEYCGNCGQRHEPQVHSVKHFAAEAFESITHADSRLWRTLWFLLAKPGRLTSEFFAGRRARYLPPFRLYLVLSILFFLVLGMRNGDDPGVIAAPAPSATSEPGAAREASAETAAALRGSSPDTVIRTRVKIDFVDDFCAPFQVADDGSRGKARRDGIRRMCARFDSGEFQAVGEAVLQQLPRAMFLFLPVLALCMKLLYWRPKRYYVEHLLFLVHNHAFVFLLFSLSLLLGIALRGVGSFPAIFWAAFLYACWYIYRAMRNVYGQGRALTLAKYFFLCVTYLMSAFLMLIFTFIYAAMTA